MVQADVVAARPSATPATTTCVAFQRRAVARLERIPGVTAASLSYGLPYKGLRGIDHYVGDGAGSTR